MKKISRTETVRDIFCFFCKNSLTMFLVWYIIKPYQEQEEPIMKEFKTEIIEKIVKESVGS